MRTHETLETLLKTRTVLVIPAAGSSTRLRSSAPKVLSLVNGRPMIDHLVDRYERAVERFVLVLHPSFEAAVRGHCAAQAPRIDYVQQAEPTGMLDAILLAHDALRAAAPDRIWITWGDQIGIHPDTVATLSRLSREQPGADVIFPTARQSDPYIHIDRDPHGRIIGIRHRREGDALPPLGESDSGLFSLSPRAYFNLLPQFAREIAAGDATRERNFLPFIPWLSMTAHQVLTFPCRDDMEAVGINTPEDRDRVEQYLRQRE